MIESLSVSVFALNNVLKLSGFKLRKGMKKGESANEAKASIQYIQIHEPGSMEVLTELVFEFLDIDTTFKFAGELGELFKRGVFEKTRVCVIFCFRGILEKFQHATVDIIIYLYSRARRR